MKAMRFRQDHAHTKGMEGQWLLFGFFSHSQTYAKSIALLAKPRDPTVKGKALTPPWKQETANSTSHRPQGEARLHRPCHRDPRHPGGERERASAPRSRGASGDSRPRVCLCVCRGAPGGDDGTTHDKPRTGRGPGAGARPAPHGRGGETGPAAGRRPRRPAEGGGSRGVLPARIPAPQRVAELGTPRPAPHRAGGGESHRDGGGRTHRPAPPPAAHEDPAPPLRAARRTPAPRTAHSGTAADTPGRRPSGRRRVGCAPVSGCNLHVGLPRRQRGSERKKKSLGIWRFW